MRECENLLPLPLGEGRGEGVSIRGSLRYPHPHPLPKGKGTLVSFAALLSLLAAPVFAADSRVDYATQIKPLLKERCYACHGALKQNSGLRVDTAASLVRGGDSGSPVVPGKSEDSLIIEAVTGDLNVWRMPPEGEPLTSQQISLLRRWIDQGAPLPAAEEPEPDPRQHWAFQPPVRPSVPPVKNAAWVRNPIDAFLAAEHERLCLAPAASAPDHVLVRRVYLDLIGLPPTREDVDEFHRLGYDALIERLLNSPQHGQRWARHWMDIWRYSDWSGENKNLVRGSPRHIWRWRDWIVESLNADKGYDRMIVEMLAGDEAAPGDADVLRATGFLARNWYEFNRNVWLDDTVEHTAKAFLGLSLGCARCHDHKFDPLAQRDYYAWRAIFEPHDVRIDSVPGQPNTELDGLPRVFDARPETPTFLFIRGEETRPDKEHPLAAAVPPALGGRFEIQPVSLPLAAWYPALLPEAREEQLRAAKANVAAAEKQLAAMRGKSDAAGSAIELAERKLAAAQAELASLEARIAAEVAKYANILPLPLGEGRGEGDQIARDDNPHPNPLPKGEGTALAADLPAAAVAADRVAALRRAELAVSQAELKTSSARRTAESKAGDKKASASASAAEKELQTAKRALAAAEAAMQKADASYAPLGPQSPATSTGRRLALARWLTDPANPLTARVAVNHVWLRHFGRPLVDPVDDFGRRTPRPRHAALLDWLAVELVESGWSLKHLHRLIVTSSAYRLTSSAAGAPPANLQIDPENHWLWRMNSRRAEGEVIRDSILHVAGRLDLSHGGPEIPLDQAETSRRRSLYFRHAHERQVPFLDAFDGADAMECYRRSVTVVPQQALALANSTLPYEQARLLAQKLTADERSADDRGFVALAFEHLLTRPPTAAERDLCLEFMQSSEQPGEAAALQARASLIHALLNHNDFITIR